MRVIFVYTIIAFGALYSLKGPFQALLFYLWIAYFRPDYWIGYTQLIWQLNLSFIVMMVLLGSTIVTGQRLRFGIGPILMGLFLADSYLSVQLSTEPEYGWVFWRMFAPSIVSAYLIVVLVTSEERLRQVFLVIMASLAFEGAKQGWAQFLIDPGGRNYNEHAMMGDNNGVAVAMFMLVPIVIALAKTASTKAERNLHRFLAFGLLYRGVVTYSRGGFLSCAGLALHTLFRSKQKFAAAMAIVVAVLVIAPVLPQAFWNRMHTIPIDAGQIEDPDSTDKSIRSRIHFWKVALMMVQDHPLTGVGFATFNAVYDDYDFRYGQFGQKRSVHSVWFAALAEMGIPGFLILLTLLVYGLRACRRARRLGKLRPDCASLAIWGNAIEAALFVFAIGGTFVIFNNEMLWHYLALAAVLDRLVTERLKAAAPESVHVAARPEEHPAREFVFATLAPARRTLPRRV
jgi:probable O-glycosylation ligase (exosortase A-associated)